MIARKRRQLVADRSPAGEQNTCGANTPVFTPGFLLLSRSYCHLCDDMLEALKALNIAPQVLEVDDHAEWVALYDEKVPVLLFQNVEVCHHRLDAAALQCVLSEAHLRR